jgi:hypothetical protein
VPLETEQNASKLGRVFLRENGIEILAAERRNTTATQTRTKIKASHIQSARIKLLFMRIYLRFLRIKLLFACRIAFGIGGVSGR